MPPEKHPDKLCAEISVIDGRVDSLHESFTRVEGKVERIDEKLDAVTTMLQNLVRIEERQVAMNERLTEGNAKFSDHSKRLTALEGTANKLEGATRIIVWVIGIVQVIGLGIWTLSRAEITSIQAKVSMLEIRQIERLAREKP